MAQPVPEGARTSSTDARSGASDRVSHPLLSIVIPVFNGTLYLPQLLDNLLAQERVPDEVIVVDDGSTDGSSEIIARLGAGLPSLRVIRQENQGQAVARNVGMQQVTGRYLVFLDVDDVPEAGMYATLVDLAEGEELDIAMCNAWNFYEGRKPDTLVYRDVPDTGVITGETWLQRRLLAGYLPHYCWMHLYRRSFIEEIGVAFPPADPHEDVLWVTETLLAARRFHFVPRPLLWYRKKETYPAPPPVPAPGGTFHRHKTIEASMYNVRALSEVAGRETLQTLTRKLLRRDFVNSGNNVVKQIRGLSDPAQRAYYLKRVRQERFFAILWRNAAGLPQHWRVLRYHILAYLLAVAVYFSPRRWHIRRRA